jgi:hypothetical protein
VSSSLLLGLIDSSPIAERIHQNRFKVQTLDYIHTILPSDPWTRCGTS